VLPLLALPAAALWAEARSAGTRAMAATLLVMSVVITISLVVVDSGRLVYNFRDGFSLAAERLSPIVDLPRGMPSFFRQTWPGAVARGAIWIGALCGAFLAVAAIGRRPDARRETLAWAAPACVAVAIMVALTLVWELDRVQAATPQTSALHVLEHYNPRIRPLAISFNPFLRGAPEAFLQRLIISTPTRRPAQPRRTLLVVPDVVPAGQYLLIPSEGSDRSRAAGHAKLNIGRLSHPISTWDLSGAGGLGLELFLPVDVASLVVEGDDAAAASGRWALHPKNVLPRASLPTSAPARRAEPYGGAVAYFFDARAFPEDRGIWIAGGAASSFAVTLAGNDASQLVLRNAPVKNRVTLEIDAERQVLNLGPGEERTIPLRPSPNRATLIRVQTTSGFYPSEVEPGSTDTRFLGVWMELR